MRKNYTFLLLLLAFALSAVAQNAHWEYQFFSSGNPVAPTSAVTVANSSGKIYLFQTDPNGIYVSLLDPANMLPMATDYEYLWSGSNFVLEGGYGDFNNNIVVYGSYDLGMGVFPIVGLYDVTTNDFTVYFQDNSHPGDYFVNGCCGYDIYGNTVHALVLENAGQLVCVDWNNGFIDFLEAYNSNYSYTGKISDVAWDAAHECFAAAGYIESGLVQLFLLGVKYDMNNGWLIPQNSSFAWYLADPTFSFGGHRTCLEIISSSKIIVGHSVRDQLNTQTDGIWLSVVDNYTYMLNSVFFDMPAPKLYLFDMKFDDTRDQLTLLCEMDHLCGRVNVLAQVDPSLLSGMNAAQVKGNVPNNYCLLNQSLYDNEIYLKKLEINNLPWSCAKILASGIYDNVLNGSDAYVTETYDIVNSQCDNVFSPGDYGVPYAVNTVNYTHTYYPTYYYQGPALLSSGPLYENWSCPDPMPCSKGVAESSKRMKEEVGDKAEIAYGMEGKFEFKGFTGGIRYSVYNALGQCVLFGNTYNGDLRLDLPDTGFYIIKAEDNSGNVVVKKIICTY